MGHFLFRVSEFLGPGKVQRHDDEAERLLRRNELLVPCGQRLHRAGSPRLVLP